MSSSSLILLSSRDATKPSTTNDDLSWAIPVPRANIMNGFQLDLLSCEFVNAVYPINRFYNSLSVLEDTGAATLTVTLTSSSYTGSSLATHIASILTTASAATGNSNTYTGSYDSATKKITISSDDAFAWRAVSANDAYEQIGVTTLTAAVAASVVGDVPINLSGSAYIDVYSNFSNNNWSSSASAKVFARLPLAGDFGDFIALTFVEQEPIYVASPDLSRLQITLRDDRGNPWELPSTFHISFVFNLIPLPNPSDLPGSAGNSAHNIGYGSLGVGSALTLPH